MTLDPVTQPCRSHKVLIPLDMAGLLGPASPQLSGLYTGPYFSLYTAGNVSVREGDIAHLPCRVHQVWPGDTQIVSNAGCLIEN